MSLEYALEAYRLYEELGDNLNAAYNLMQLGIIYFTSQNYQKSLFYYGQSIDLYSQIGNTEKMATLHYLSALSQLKLEQHDPAMAEFMRALSFHDDNTPNQVRAECLLGIAELFFLKAQADSALVYAQSTLNYIDTANNDYGHSKVSILRSKVYRLKGDRTACMYYARSALEAAQRENARELMLEAYDAMTNAPELNGDYRSAFQMNQAYLALRDSMFSEKNLIRISQLESAYQLEKNEKQIGILEREKKIRDILLKGTAAIALLVLALSFVLFNRFQIKKKANRNLKEAYDKLTETQEQLLHHKKMASLGRLVTGLSHEIQNPLNFVNNFSEITLELLQELESTPLNAGQRDLVVELLKGADKVTFHGRRAQQIVKQMQDHSNMNPGGFENAELNPLILQCLERAYLDMKTEHPEFDCKVVRQLDTSLPSSLIQVSQIRRVWYNVFKNAFQAVYDKSRSEISFVPEVMVESRLHGNQLQITCRDNGIGMDEETKERAFEPFYTTKPAGSATGLGLSITYEIIIAHRGDIKLSSVKGEFTELVIRIPADAHSQPA